MLKGCLWSVLQRCHTQFAGLGKLDIVAIGVHMLQQNSIPEGAEKELWSAFWTVDVADATGMAVTDCSFSMLIPKRVPSDTHLCL